MNTENFRLKMVCYWQWVKRQVFTRRSNKAFNKVNRIKSLRLFWCIYILATGNIAVKMRDAADTAEICLMNYYWQEDKKQS